MPLPRLWFVLLTACLLAALPPVARAQSTAEAAPDTTSLLHEIQARYEALDGLQAQFMQEMNSDVGGRSPRMQGRLWLQGDKYRIETRNQTLVTDGTTTWIYAPADNQVVINNARQDASTLSPQTLLTDYAARYAIASQQPVRINGTDHQKLTLQPTASSVTFTDVTLWMRRADRIVTRVRVTDRDGSTLTITLDDIRLNPPLPPRLFAFDPPPSAEVVDLRSS